MILAALLSTLPMLGVFEAEVRVQSARFGIPAPRVIVVASLPRADRWAWINLCPVRVQGSVTHVTACEPTISVRSDVLTLVGEAAVRMAAAHEVIHVVRGDHLDPAWGRDDAYSLSRQREVHAKIELEVLEAFDLRTRRAAGRDVRAWLRIWGKASWSS